MGFPRWDTCGNNLHNNDKGIHIVCYVQQFWRENQLVEDLIRITADNFYWVIVSHICEIFLKEILKTG